MIKRNYSTVTVLVLLLVTIMVCAGCGDKKARDINSNEIVKNEQSTTQAAKLNETQKQTQKETQMETKAGIPPVIYISAISNSARTVHYSLTKDFVISDDALAFDNDCKFYNNLEQQVSFIEFANKISESNKQSKTVKCKMVTKDDNYRVIKEAYILE